MAQSELRADIKLLDLDSDGRIQLKYQPNLMANDKEAIIQAIINNLMTTPGRDAFNQTRGGGLLGLLRSKKEVGEVIASISSIISYVKDEFMAEQANSQATVVVEDIKASEVRYDPTRGIYFTITVLFNDGEEETITF